MSSEAIIITQEDAATLRGVERAFNKRLWGQLGADDRHYQTFERNLGLHGRVMIAFHAIGADLEQARREKADPGKIARHLGRAFDAMLPSLKKSFGEAKVLQALPVECTDTRLIDVFKKVGAKGLADLCEKKASTLALAGGSLVHATAPGR